MNYLSIHKCSDALYRISYKEYDSQSSEVERAKVVRFLDECIDCLMINTKKIASEYGYVQLDAGEDADQ